MLQTIDIFKPGAYFIEKNIVKSNTLEKKKVTLCRERGYYSHRAVFKY